VGGSGLYYKVLLDGIFDEEEPNQKLRQRLYQEAKEYGTYFLYERLKKIDPKSTSKIHPNDLKRIVRALEVYEKTGIPISEWQKKAKGIFKDYEVKVFGIFRSKEMILKRVRQRTESMFRKGLLEEVKKLLKLKLSKTAKEAIGIKEIEGYLEGRYSLTETKKLIIKNTLRLVKKQFTWFKKDPRIYWINIDDEGFKKAVQIILEKIK
jgi:tRNA dimethylallyltransferase